MTAKEFNALPFDQRAQLVAAHGQLVDERVEYGKFTIDLYAVHGLYVEVYTSVKDMSVHKVHALDEGTDWQGYLDSIKIDHLMP